MRKRINVGDRCTNVMPYSEVCVHMRVAGKEVEIELLNESGAVQLYQDGEPFSIPILSGEAGVYGGSTQGYYILIKEEGKYDRHEPATH